MYRALLLLMNIIKPCLLFRQDLLVFLLSVVCIIQYLEGTATTTGRDGRNTQILLMIIILDEILKQGHTVVKIDTVLSIYQDGRIYRVQLCGIDTIIKLSCPGPIAKPLLSMFLNSLKIQVLLFIHCHVLLNI